MAGRGPSQVITDRPIFACPRKNARFRQLPVVERTDQRQGILVRLVELGQDRFDGFALVTFLNSPVEFGQLIPFQALAGRLRDTALHPNFTPIDNANLPVQHMG